MNTRLTAVSSGLVGQWRLCSGCAVLLALLWAGLAGPALGAPDDPREDRILEHIARLRAEFAALEAPDSDAVRAYVDRVQLAADVARSLRCDWAEAEAQLVLGDFHGEHGPSEQSEADYRRALDAARRGVDWSREIRALEGILTILLRSGSDEAQDRFGEALAAYLDVSTVHDRLFDALTWIDAARQGSPLRVRPEHRELVGVVVLGRDYLAHARVKRDKEAAREVLRRFQSSHMPLLAGAVAEEFEIVEGLEAALRAHRERGDARAEARASARLLGLRPDGEGAEELRRRGFDAAVRAGDHELSAELASNEELKATYRRLALQEAAEHDEEPLTDWQRDGRWPDEPDGFYDMLDQGLTLDGDYMKKLTLITYAHVDGSRAYVPLFFRLFEDPAYLVRDRAAKAVGELATTEHLSALREALHGEHWDVRRQVAMTLGRLADEDPSILDLLAERLDEETSEAVKAALRWGLVRAGKHEHLNDLKAQLRSPDERVAATAAVGLFDLGFTSAAPILERTSRPGVKSDAAEDVATLLGYTTNPETVFFLERLLRSGSVLPQVNAARSLMRFDTPRAQADRKNRMQPSPRGSSSDYLCWGLRDARRGRWTSEEILRLIDTAITKHLDRYHLDAEALEWITGERTGHVGFRLTVGDDKWTGRDRNLLRGLKGRKTDGLWDRDGSQGTKSVDLFYTADVTAAALHVDLRPTALLVDPTHLTVDLRRTQRHSGFMRDVMGKVWVNEELVWEAEDALKSSRLEEVGSLSGPVAGSGQKTLSFAVPEGVTTEALRQATLVLEFRFFGKEKTVRFAIAPILRVGDEIRPDLVPENLGVVPDAPRPSAHCLVLFDVVNAGCAKAQASTAVVYARNRVKPDGRREIGRVQVPALGEGERAELALGVRVSDDLYLSGYAPGWTPDDQDTAIEVVLDADDRIEETDEGNNRGVRPVALVLTDEERGARDQDEVLAKLDALASTVEGFGPEAEPERMRETLDEMLEQLDAIRPRTPGLQKARRMLRMLEAQMEARDRIRKAIPRILEFDPASGSDADAAEMLGDLLRAQADLLRSGVPVASDQVAQIRRHLDAFRGAFGTESGPLDADQHEALRHAEEQIRLGRGTRDIFGASPVASGMDPTGGLGPETDPEKRRAAEAFLRRNLDWNREGMDLAGSTFDQAIGTQDRWFDASELDAIRTRWQAWSKPPEETALQVEAIGPEIESTPGGAAAQKSSRNLLKRLGF